MKRIMIAVGALTLALASLGNAQGTATSKEAGDHYTESQIKKLAKEAHSPEQYGVLATYYGNRQQLFLVKAADEKQEWARRSQYTTSISAKYTRPVDSARNLYEYYVQEASDAGALSDRYHRLAGPTAQGQAL
jgi:hypothetical protein